MFTNLDEYGIIKKSNKTRGECMIKKEMIAMLLAGGQGSRLGVLTAKVAKPAVAFGGKYRIIDFPLSNCINSGIDTVGVLTQYQHIATLSCSVVSKVNPETKILEDVRITFGVAAPVPYRCVETEELLKGRKLGEELYRKLEDSIRSEIHPRDSWRASKAFRLQIGGEIARRALIRTVELAGVPADSVSGGEMA